VTALQDGREASAEAEVEVVEEIADGGPRTGIPEPAFVADPRGEWRSPHRGRTLEVNAAHRDYLSVEATPRRKLRYLAALLAKEIVLHSYPMPQGGMLLERLVSVADRGGAEAGARVAAHAGASGARPLATFHGCTDCGKD